MRRGNEGAKMHVSTTKDDYRIQQARLERLAKELSPGCKVHFDPDKPPTWVRMRVDDPNTGTILMLSSGDWHVSEIADKTDDEIRQLMRSWSGGGPFFEFFPPFVYVCITTDP